MSFGKTRDFVSKVLFSIGLLALAFIPRAKSLTVTVIGAVTDAEGQPVEAVEVFISCIFADSTFYFSTATTDALGTYQEDIPVPFGQTEGMMSISSIGCDGTFTYFMRSWSVAEMMIVQDFEWCDNMNFGDSCVALVLPNVDPLTGMTSLYALHSAPEPATYLWNDGSTAQSVIAIDTGIYCVTVTGANDCTVSACHAFGLGTDCFVSIAPGNGGLNDGTLQAVGFGVAPMTYLWSTGDTGQVIMINDPGTFCVTVTDGEGCESEGCYDYLTGIFEVAASYLSVAPQPVFDFCRLTVPEEIAGTHILVLTAINGQVVKRFYNIFKGGTEAYVDVADLLPGMYIIRLQAGQEVWLGKLVKQGH